MSLGPIMVDLRGTGIEPDERELIAHPNVGGVILFTRNFESPAQLRALCDGLRAIGDTRRLLAVDHEGGRVQRFRDGFTRIPPMRRFGERFAEDRVRARRELRRVGRTIARELRAHGIDLCFAPVLDLDHGLSEIIGDRSFGRDPDMVASLGAALRQGLKDCGLSATGKHFPGHGAVAADSHLELPVDHRGLDALREDMRPFARLIARGLESVMMAHIRYPAVDELPASLSARWIGGILRGELGFGGAVFCDDLSMNGARVIADPVERAVLALEAGCDMVPVCNAPEVAQRVVDGVPVRRREAAGRRLLALQIRG